MIDGWRYYNHAMVTTGGPGAPVNMEPLENGQIWHRGGYALFARWNTDYDCGHPTEWWYCLKDDEYRIDTINSKKRYRITRGRRFFDVRRIDEKEYYDELVDIQIKSFFSYPEEYRPDLSKEKRLSSIKGWQKQRHNVFAAFSREDSTLCGYALINEYEDYCFFVQQKVDPNCEKNEINAALVDGVLTFYNEKILNGYPLVDGQRNTLHETAFQDYLCRIFGFRKAYCRLNIKYRTWVGMVVKLLYPYRQRIAGMKGSLCHQISSVLQMEEIRRSFD